MPHAVVAVAVTAAAAMAVVVTAVVVDRTVANAVPVPVVGRIAAMELETAVVEAPAMQAAAVMTTDAAVAAAVHLVVEMLVGTTTPATEVRRANAP